MTIVGRLFATLLLTVLGTMLGLIVGLITGLVWTTLEHTSGFEGYSGFVVLYHMLFFGVIGFIAGLGYGLMRAPPQRPDA